MKEKRRRKGEVVFRNIVTRPIAISRVLREQRPTDGPTDGPTDRQSGLQSRVHATKKFVSDMAQWGEGIAHKKRGAVSIEYLA